MDKKNLTTEETFAIAIQNLSQIKKNILKFVYEKKQSNKLLNIFLCL